MTYKFYSLIATFVVSGLCTLSAHATTLPVMHPAESVSTSTLKIHDDYDFHSRWRSHYRWGSRGGYGYQHHRDYGDNGYRHEHGDRRYHDYDFHTRWRSHYRWGSHHEY